jgi:hypothetical protein
MARGPKFQLAGGAAASEAICMTRDPYVEEWRRLSKLIPTPGELEQQRAQKRKRAERRRREIAETLEWGWRSSNLVTLDLREPSDLEECADEEL